MLLNPNYWLAGVDYEDINWNKSSDKNDDENNSHKYDIKQDERVDAEEHCKLIRRIYRHTLKYQLEWTRWYQWELIRWEHSSLCNWYKSIYRSIIFDMIV